MHNYLALLLSMKEDLHLITPINYLLSITVVREAPNTPYPKLIFFKLGRSISLILYIVMITSYYKGTKVEVVCDHI